MHIWGRVGSGQTFCQQSRVGLSQRFAGSGPRKVTRGQLWMEIPSFFDQHKPPRGNLTPPISLSISPKRLRFSYLCLRHTFRGILEEYFDENNFVLGESSAKL